MRKSVEDLLQEAPPAAREQYLYDHAAEGKVVALARLREAIKRDTRFRREVEKLNARILKRMRGAYNALRLRYEDRPEWPEAVDAALGELLDNLGSAPDTSEGGGTNSPASTEPSSSVDDDNATEPSSSVDDDLNNLGEDDFTDFTVF